nr:unnamed protein product [Digitaria exilis]
MKKKKRGTVGASHPSATPRHPAKQARERQRLIGMPPARRSPRRRPRSATPPPSPCHLMLLRCLAKVDNYRWYYRYATSHCTLQPLPTPCVGLGAKLLFPGQCARARHDDGGAASSTNGSARRASQPASAGASRVARLILGRLSASYNTCSKGLVGSHRTSSLFSKFQILTSNYPPPS